MAREEAPIMWSDEDDLVVMREPLDHASTGSSSVSIPAPSSPDTATEPGSGMRPTSADLAGASPASASTPLSRIAWERTLTLRQRILRGSGITLVVALTIYLLAGGPGLTLVALHQAGAAINARLHPPVPQPTLEQRGYTFIKSPPGAYNLPQMSVAPAMGKDNAAWTCWTSRLSSSSQASSGAWTTQAYYTSTGGAGWTALKLPQLTAQDCSITADSQRSDSALFVLDQGQAPDGSCIAPYLYLTNDTGASWTHVPWPLGPSDGACQFQTSLQNGTIYIWSTGQLLRGFNAYAPPTGRLVVSRDAGQTWSVADTGLDDSTEYDIIGFRPGGHILASIADVRGSGGSALLMSSDDYGASWRSLGPLPGDFPQVAISTDDGVTDHGGWGRLYALSRTEINGQPSIPPQYELATAYAGQGWTPIPLPPLDGEANATSIWNQPILLGVGPARSIEVERGIVEAANAQLSPSRRLWVWNPAVRQWLLDPQVVPGNLELQGAAWRAGTQTYWVTTLQLGVPPILRIYTKSYPADLLQRLT
ncbi:MAG TPA: sialidase family protein [Ktedonobacterales bacterium]|jgi:hypothetical protein|nr:sialidase family protein [Ktedonobacterales bacterium]